MKTLIAILLMTGSMAHARTNMMAQTNYCQAVTWLSDGAKAMDRCRAEKTDCKPVQEASIMYVKLINQALAEGANDEERCAGLNEQDELRINKYMGGS